MPSVRDARTWLRKMPRTLHVPMMNGRAGIFATKKQQMHRLRVRREDAEIDAAVSMSRTQWIWFTLSHRRTRAKAAGFYGTLATTRRAASDSISREMPLKRMLIPMSTPMTHEADQVRQIRNARTSVTRPSIASQPEPGRGCRRYDNRNSRIASANR